MTRVHERHVSTGPSAADRHRRVDQKRKASYKVIFEEVADKQKKLKTVLYPEQKAPRGYTFIPAGDPQLTNRCKKLAREDGFTVFIVSTSRHPRQGLSREIHRVGFHFPSVTVEKACDSLGVTLSNSGRVLQSNFAHLEEGQERNGSLLTKQKKQKAGNRNAQPVLDISLPQAVIDTSAREAIKDLFPNIPSQDLHVIVGRSFQKGKGLVGTVANLSLVRRAQLAVIAHIRHTYTNYDFLLKQVQYNEARRQVEKPCLDRLIQWRGDDGDAGNMDDVLREVIVIPDDDDEDDIEKDEVKDNIRRRSEEGDHDSSVEYISEADMQVQPVDYSNTNRTVGRGDSYSPESDGEVQYLGRTQLHHGRQAQYDQQMLDRMGMHRQRVYEEALDRRRKRPENLDLNNDYSSLTQTASSGQDSIHPLSQHPQDRIYAPRLTERREQAQERGPVQTRLMPIARSDGYSVNPFSRPSDPRHVIEEQAAYPPYRNRRAHEASLEQPKGMYYAEQDKFHNYSTQSREVRQNSNAVFDENGRIVSQNDIKRDTENKIYTHDFGTQAHRRSEMVLPSIERDDGLNETPSLYREVRQVNPLGSYHPLPNRGLQQLPARSIINLNNYEEPPNSKRRRIDDQQPVSSHDQARTVLVPIEQIDDRRPRYERPHEAVYLDDTKHFALDKRIVPLPPKEERARSPFGHQEPQRSSREQSKRLPDQVADRVERYPQPRDHYQFPLFRSEKVDDLQFPSHAFFSPPKYSKDSSSSSFFSPSQSAPRSVENSDMDFPLRHNVGVATNSDRTDANSNGMTRRLQPLEVAERLPSRLSDMSIDYRRREGNRRAGNVTYLPSTPTTGVHRHTGLSTAKDGFHENTAPRTNAQKYDIPGDHLRHLPGMEQQSIWPVKRHAESSYQLDQQFSEANQAKPLGRRAPAPAPRAAIEPWDTNIQSLDRQWEGLRAGGRPHNGMNARSENIRPFQHEDGEQRPGHRKWAGDIVVLD